VDPKNLTPAAYPNYLVGLGGDFINKTNMYRMVREFARYGGIDKGFYAEFGIMNGETAVAAYRQLRGIVTDIFGFDTFSGHPAHQEVDKKNKEYSPYFFEGNYSAVSKEFAQANLKTSTLLKDENIHLYEGKFCDTLPKFDKNEFKKAGFPVCVMVDCDLYSSAKDVFSFLTDVLQTGSWLLVDDYWCYRGDPKLGVRRAMDEWLESNGRIGVTHYTNFNAFSRAYICHEK
jgi:O-methyltransferase